MYQSQQMNWCISAPTQGIKTVRLGSNNSVSVRELAKKLPTELNKIVTNFKKCKSEASRKIFETKNFAFVERK